MDLIPVKLYWNRLTATRFEGVSPVCRAPWYVIDLNLLRWVIRRQCRSKHNDEVAVFRVAHCFSKLRLYIQMSFLEKKCSVEDTKTTDETYQAKQCDEDSGDGDNEEELNKPSSSLTTTTTTTSCLLPGNRKGFLVSKVYPPVPPHGFLNNPLFHKLVEESNKNEKDRLKLRHDDVTLPVALMLLDPTEYTSISSAKRACRKGHIIVRHGPVDIENDEAAFVSAELGFASHRIKPNGAFYSFFTRYISQRRVRAVALSLRIRNYHFSILVLSINFFNMISGDAYIRTVYCRRHSKAIACRRWLLPTSKSVNTAN